MDILRNPTTVKLLARQLIVACDSYLSLSMPEKQLKELLFHFASQHPKKLFTLSGNSPGGLNPTIANRIGKKRCDLIQRLLEGFQRKLF